MDNSTITTLLKLLKTGNKSAFDQLFRLFYIRLRNYSIQITKDKSASEDIVQEIFFHLWNKPEVTEKINSLEAYLRTSVYNRSVGYIKEKNKRNLTEINSHSVDLDSLNLQILSYQRDTITEKELTFAISQAVEKLPEQCRLVFKLSRNFGFKNTEIANHLGISIKGVEKHITKALQHLRNELIEFISILIFFLYSNKF
jgi:RNA polymerase sigma-70 factor (ECF subfamily)